MGRPRRRPGSGRREDLRRRPVGDDPAGVDEDEPREEDRRQTQVVEDREDRRAVAHVEIDEQLHGPDLVPKVEVDRRLVEDEHRSGLGDGQREQDELPLPKRQLPGVAPEEVPHPDSLDRRRDGGPIGRPGAPERILVRQPAERDDLLDPRRERQRRLLRNDRQPSGDRPAVELVDRHAIERCPARGRPHAAP